MDRENKMALGHIFMKPMGGDLRTLSIQSILYKGRFHVNNGRFTFLNFGGNECHVITERKCTRTEIIHKMVKPICYIPQSNYTT